ncbi:ATP synthase subunit I [Polaribacter litorisediminis]|uniref:ATP synthase subunit I n=1 Tax=Polaribacter litorisediminis TaxID=1908341 RepID=UPI001CBE1EE1|nr:ATP synthase subunit I [Polaribacter litorisediminis]UAM98167.1 ATP synthase subunit I [Polaribacter litorisediminis]
MILIFLAGVILGITFYGGLWFTVKKSITAKRPTMLFLSSFFIRIGITVIGFYLIGGHNWQYFLGCLLGFIVARFVVFYITKTINIKQFNLTREKIHGTQP